MNKTELEETIKNGESVWVVDLKNKIITENKRHKHFKKLLATQRENRIPFDRIFTTRRQAEHYLHHANITRTETLPFLTWEEFTSDIMAFNSFSFITEDGFRASLMYDKASDLIILDSGKEIKTWDLTKENFYKAYDECVKLFRGE